MGLNNSASYCLWLNGKKIYDAVDIPDNFDLISLRGYFLGGSLLKWLESHSGNNEAVFINENYFYSDTSEIDINLILECAFGIKSKADYELQKNNQIHDNKVTNSTYHSYTLNKKTSFSLKASSYNNICISYKNKLTGSGFGQGSKRLSGSKLSSFKKGSFNTLNDIIMNEILIPLNQYGYGIHLI